MPFQARRPTAAFCLVALLALVALAAACTRDAGVPSADDHTAPPPSPVHTAPGSPPTQGTQDEEDDAEPTKAPSPEPPPAVDDPWEQLGDPVNGMAVLAYTRDGAAGVRAKAMELLDRLVALGVNAVSLNVPVYQAGARATKVSSGPLTPSAEAIEAFVAAAHARNIAVMLRPTLDEESLVPTGHWRGSIRPADVDAWFNSYGDLLERFARVAEANDVAMLNVGTELSSLERYTRRWRAVIARVRDAYGGLVTYSTNFDRADRGPVAFSNHLDFQSIDAFFPLDVGRRAGPKRLASAWRSVVADLEEQGWDLDELVFTEIGVTAQVGAHRKPYVWDHKTARDEKVRARYYAGSCRALVPQLAGLYWWAADLNHPDGSSDTPTFDPLGTPAEEQIRACFADSG